MLRIRFNDGTGPGTSIRNNNRLLASGDLGPEAFEEFGILVLGQAHGTPDFGDGLALGVKSAWLAAKITPRSTAMVFVHPQRFASVSIAAKAWAESLKFFGFAPGLLTGLWGGFLVGTGVSLYGNVYTFQHQTIPCHTSVNTYHRSAL